MRTFPRRPPRTPQAPSPGGPPTPRGSGSRLRPLATPQPIRVHTDTHHNPLALWSGRGWVRIEAIREEWRIDDEWWRTLVSRDYRVVVLANSRVATIYRDRTSSTWYRQG